MSKRSEAARKGWLTRRANLAQKEAKREARSQAAKRGWETRKAIAPQAVKPKVSKPARRPAPKSAKPPRRPAPKPSSAARSQAAKRGWETRRKRAQEKAQESKKRIQLTAAVRATLQKRGLRKTESVLKMLRRDGTDAKHASMVRHRPYANELLDRMNSPDFEGDYADFEAMADEHGDDIREIYTLFFS